MLITLDQVREFVFQHFQKVLITKGGTHFQARCVLCGDSKKSKSKRRFNLDYKNGLPAWHCWNCGRSGSFVELYAELNGLSYNDAKKELDRYDPDRIIKALSAPKYKPDLYKDIPYNLYNSILKDCIGLSDEPDGIIQTAHKKALVKFANERKISPNFRIYIAYHGDYKGRVIIPIFNNNDMIYFQGRSLESNPERKYKNPPTEKSRIIYNLDKFKRDKYIIVVEGLLDADGIPNQGTSSLGVEITDEFIKKLLDSTDKGVILALDNDAPGRKATFEYMNTGKFSHLTKYFIPPHKYKEIKDINDLVTKCGIEDIYEFVSDNSFSKFDAMVKLKMN
jgi:5S rRNA maturation endonuclease (ribonuclease M5)